MRLSATILLVIAAVSASCATTKRGGFRFEDYKSRYDFEVALDERVPAGTATASVVSDLEDGGAKCRAASPAMDAQLRNNSNFADAPREATFIACSYTASTLTDLAWTVYVLSLADKMRSTYGVVTRRSFR